jgi:hypothetical protein
MATTINNQAFDSPSSSSNWLENMINTSVNNFITLIPTNMTFLKGEGIRQLTPYDQNQLITVQYGHDNLSLYNLNINNFSLEYNIPSSNSASGVVNTFIGNVQNNTNDITMGIFNGNAFNNIQILVTAHEDNKYLAGGGILGVRSVLHSASISEIEGNFFNNIRIMLQSSNGPGPGPYLEGGGIIGVNGDSSPGQNLGFANLEFLLNNVFTDIAISSADIILGGGVVGVNNNSQASPPVNPPTATLSSVYRNIFGNGKDGNITVSAEYSLRGGGIVGVNGLSSSYATLDGLNHNVFAGIDVTIGTYIRGGGIVGVQSKCGGIKDCAPPDSTNDDISAYLSLLNNNVFYNIDIIVGNRLNGGEVLGGGVIGVSSPNMISIIDTISNNIFKDINVTIKDKRVGHSGTTYDGVLRGGGIIGAYADQNAEVLNVIHNFFDNINITVDKNIYGGGIIGSSASSTSILDSFSLLGRIHHNSFKNIHIKSGGMIEGGGILGLYSPNGNNTLLGLDTEELSDDYGITGLYNNVFSSIFISNLDSNFINGIYGGGILGAKTNEGYALIGPVLQSDFYNIDVRSKFIEGGGVIGVYSNDFSLIYSVNQSNFIYNNITVSNYIDGGGIIGVTGDSDSLNGITTGIHEIKNSFFLGNKITANNGIIMGGIVYSYGGFGDGLTIQGSWFEDNEFNAGITDETAYKKLNTSNQATMDDLDPKSRGAFGTVTIDTGVNNGTSTTNQAVLKLVGTADSSVVFSNNKITAYGSVRYNSIYFGSIPEYDYGSSGYEAANNDTPAIDALLSIETLDGGSVALFDPILIDQTTLTDNSTYGFIMNVTGTGDFIWAGDNFIYTDSTVDQSKNTINFISGSTTINNKWNLTAEYHNLNLISDARLNVLGNNVMTVNQASLNGTIYFNLGNTIVNDPSTALLKINANYPVDIDGSNILLGDIPVGAELQPGDRFYLINSVAPGNITTNQTTKVASARQGLLLRYNFVIDDAIPTADPIDPDNHTAQYLVARLPYRAPQVGEPLAVYEKSAVGDPLVVYFKTAVDNPLMVEYKSAVGDPLKVEYKTAVGEPLKVEVKSAVGEPLHVEVRTAVDEPLVVYIKESVGDPLSVEYKSAVGDPLKVEFKSAVDKPLVVYVKNAVDEPLVVYTRTAVGEPLHVEYRDAVGDPVKVEFKSADDEPLHVEVKQAVGDPLVVYFKDDTDEPLHVEYKTAVGDPLVVYVKDAVGEPLAVYYKEAVGNPEVVYVYSETGEPLYKLITELPLNPNSAIFFDPPYLEIYNDARLLTDGQVAALGFISQTTSWLPDHSYQEANVAVGRTRLEAPAAGQKSLSEPSWTVFGGIDGAFIINGNQTQIQTNSTRAELGLTYRYPFLSSQFLATFFVEASYGKYQIDADYGSIFGPHVKANGTLESLATGMALRQKWDNGFRIEGSVRYGTMRNHFQSDAFTTVTNHKMDYVFSAPYWAFHLGLGYEYRINDRSSLDFMGRYFSTTLNGDTVSLETGERVRFDKTNSSRVRGGARYSREHNERISYYVGGYWEHEFDGWSNAQANIFSFQSDELKGSTFVGEIGVIFRSTEDNPWNVEAGIQGYAGRNRGFSGGARFGYRF